MKGMTLDQLKEVIEFVQEYHRFAGYKSPEKRAELKKQFPNMFEYGMGIKYVDFTYDTRTMDIWSVTFRGVGVRLSTNHYTALSMPPEDFNYSNLYDWCMDFLKGEFKATEEFLTKR